MVFHYFGSKKGLYEYLIRYSIEHVSKFLNGLDERLSGLDYLEQYNCATQIKLEAYIKNPYVFEFLSTIFLHPENLDFSPAVKELYEDTIRMRNRIMTVIKDSEDSSRFREDIDVGTAKKFIGWILDGYLQSIMARLSKGPISRENIDPFWPEFDEMLEQLKKLFYTPE